MKNAVLFLLLSCATFAQSKVEKLCIKPDITFTFKDGKEVKLCGASSIDNYYSEFILALGDSIIFEADGTQSFKIKFQGDSLQLEEYKSLPVGENRTFTAALWETTVFKNERGLTVYSKINRKLKKYNAEEVMLSIEEFRFANDSTPNKEEILAKLFIASLSEKLIAEKYLYAIQTKFHASLDGAFSEDCGNLMAMYDEWNNSKSKCEKMEKNSETTFQCTTSWGIASSDNIYLTSVSNATGICYEYLEKVNTSGCMRNTEIKFIKIYNEKNQIRYIFQFLDLKYTKTTFDNTGKIIKTETIDSPQFEMAKRRD